MTKLKKTVMVKRVVGWIKKSQAAQLKKTIRRQNLQNQIERLRKRATSKAASTRSKPPKPAPSMLKKTVMEKRATQPTAAQLKETRRRQNLQSQVEQIQEKAKNKPKPSLPVSFVTPAAPQKKAGWSKKKKFIVVGSGVGVAGAGAGLVFNRRRAKRTSAPPIYRGY